jgi:AcrR family transcriptional regulator
LKKRDKNSPTRAERLREASQKRREQEKQEVRQAILVASSELFLEHGYANFSLRQVAEKIGYSPGTIYLYFQDKDAVMFTIMEEGVRRFGEILSHAASVTDVRDRLSAIARAYVDFGLGSPAHYQLMFMQRTDFLVRDSDAQPIIAIFELWENVVEDAMKAGVLRMGDPVSTGDTLWALLHGVVSIAISMPRFDKKRVEEMVNTTLEMVSHGLHKSQ